VAAWAKTLSNRWLAIDRRRNPQETEFGMTKESACSSDNRQPDRNAAAIVVLKVIGWCLALWTVPLVFVGSFVGPHIFAGGAVSGFTALVSFALANRLAAGCKWAKWCTILFGVIVICIQGTACIQMLRKSEPFGAFVFPIIGTLLFSYLLYAVTIEIEHAGTKE
jgi:hypothetical protein